MEVAAKLRLRLELEPMRGCSGIDPIGAEALVQGFMVSMGRIVPVVLLALALPAHAQTPAQDQTPSEAAGAGTQADEARYQQKVAEAIAEYGRGNWAEARALFQQAHVLSPSARTWRTLGMTAFELRDYVSALRELSASLADARRPLDDKLRGEVGALLGRTRAFVGRFSVRIEPSTATLYVDDRAAQLETNESLLLGLGEHVLRAVAKGYAPVQRSLHVDGREDASVELKLEPEAQPSLVARPTTGPALRPAQPVTPSSGKGSGHILTWIAAASAVAFGGGAIALRVASDDEFGRLKQQCHAACKPGTVDDSKLSTLETLTTVSAITAGVAAVTAVALFFAEGTESESDARLAIDGAQPRLVIRF
jgi:tetratricopeptide (TPR) repeat protein